MRRNLDSARLVSPVERQRYFMQEKRISSIHNPDIIATSETHLKPHQKLNIQNYNTYPYDRKLRTGGGGAILIKKKLEHFPLPASKTGSPLEFIDVLMTTKNGEKIRINAAYGRLHDILDESKLDISFNSNSSDPIIIMRNLNAKNKL